MSVSEKDFSQRIASLTPEQRRLLELRLKRQQEDDVARPRPLPRLAGATSFPLSFAQQRLWFLAQLEPESTAYNLFETVRLAGRLDAGVLDRAFSEIVRRQESLRTRFEESGGQGLQVVEPPRPFAVERIDLGALPAAEREPEALRLVTRAVRVPFDLHAGGLLRATLFRLDAQHHLLLVVIHHIVSDGWSIGILLAELTALYEAFTRGAPSPLPGLPIQYADFAVWQRRWMSGGVLAEQLGYWRRRLVGAPPLLELPTDFPRPVVQSFRGGRRPVSVPGDLARELSVLGRREGLTPFMVLLAAFEVLLGRYTGQTDLSIGTPIANRRQVEIEKLVGFFVNTLVLRTDLGGDPEFVELAQRVREAALGAFSHQDLPFEKLVDELRPERTLSYSPLFQVMFNLQNARPSRVELTRLTLEPLTVEHGQAQLDLSLSFIESADGLTGWLEYNSDLFGPETAERLARHFTTLLRGIAEAPGQRLSELPLLSAAERRQLLVEWNETSVSWPGETLLHELFERQAALRPAAWAVGFGAERLSYGELSSRSNRLARHLRRWGVGAEVRVGLCVERSAAMVVALLGILKAGGVYVPLDPSHPAERLGLVMADSAVPVLVAEEGLLGRLPASAAVRVVCLDRDREAIAAESAGPLERFAEAENLAYVLYTSGSTGQPKGVALPHRAVVNFLRSMAERPGLGASDVVPALTTLSFDIAGLEIYLPLSVGGRVEVLGREEAADGARLAERLLQTGVTAMQATPATWRLLLEAGWPGIAGLKGLCGGEALPRELAEGLLSRGVELWNVYGPTETAVWSSACEVTPGEGPVLLGGPIANTELYVVDASFAPVPAPVPVGVAGELWIGGAGLSRGYLHRPELTAEKLVPHPFGVAGARVYRTGDLVRYRPSGELEFLGRIDTQVKVRGFRIELGEIEAALGGHPSVRQAVVGVRGEGGDQRLVAYLVAETAPAPAAEDLQGFLRRSLPEYMVPTAFVVLESLPLTPSGKVDRKALPAPEAGPAETGYVAPRGPVEELVAAIWAEVLRVERVGARDNFFALGGHSLLATQVVSRLRTALGVELPLQRLFATPTVAGLAQAVEEARRAARGLETPPIRPVPRDGPLPLSFAQERMWFLHQLEPLSSAYNLVSGARLEGDLDVAQLARCFTELVRRHETLRTVFAAVDGRPVQVIQPSADFELETADLRTFDPAGREAELRRRVLAAGGSPFDLAQGPLLRATLLRTADREHALLLVMHHIASDGWSMALLLGELTELYAAFTADRPSPLPELPVQYADFAVWQRGWLAGEELGRQVEYWKGRLAGAPALLELPTDRPRPAVQSLRGGRHRLTLPPELAGELESLGRREGLTPFMVLLPAFQALLGRYSSQADVVVGTPIANRTHTEIERLIGFFANTLVFRADLADDPAFLELARRVRGSALGAYDHQDLPFEKLVDELHPERHLSYPPVFQVMFILQNAPAPEVSLAGLKLLPLEVDRGQSPFDLTLMLAESAGSWSGWLEYVSDLFDAATVARWATHLEVLLGGIVAGPERRVSELPLLMEAERRQLLVEWNETSVSWPGETLLHELFERQASAQPEAWAVGFGAERLSYGELSARSNRLARHLRRWGVGAEVRVGLCVERSAEMVVALLGILKAGGVYVPLDPSHPAERLGLVMADSAVPVLVAEERLLGRLPTSAVRVVCLDRDREAIAAESAGPLARFAEAENLAYVLYTSGSTGQPKGVALPHRAVVNFLRSMAERPGLGASDVVPALTTLSFDIAGLEIYLPLSVGGRVEVLGREEAADGARLAERLLQTGVTAMQATPATWRLLLEAGWPGIAGLKGLCGGEALPRELAEGLLSRGVELWNVYGPTETAVWSSACEVIPGEGPVLLGGPIANTELYVVDAGFAPVPVGVAGELWIGGAGLSRGYLHRPELTAEKLVPHPFGVAGARVYRTGDLVRYRPSGELEFLGRIDTQVKVRGFRIELGEIEAALGGHPSVRQAVVGVRGEGGDQRLVAYLVVLAAAAAPAADELRDFLRRSLPEYMVPAAFVVLESLPLTPSGKVDRKALPAPEAGPAETGYVAPRGPVEELVAAIWAEVLRVERVGARDNFFALGGHSLLATQVVSRLRTALGVELPLQRLFATPTVAGLAQAVEEARRAARGLETPPIRPVPRDGPLPLSFAQERMWFLNQLEPLSSAYNLEIGARLEGDLDPLALACCFTELVRRHETLRTVFAAVDGRPVQVIQPSADFELETADLRAFDPAGRDAQLRRRVLAAGGSPFDLAQGPLLRATLLRTEDREHALLLVMHHIASDGWSMALLLGELTELYAAFTADRPSPLPELPVQYADFAVWQRGWLAGEELGRQVEYWKGRLAGAPALLELPTDRPRPAVQSFRGGRHRLTLPPELSGELESLGRREGLTPFMVLLSAFQALLGRYSSQADVVVGTPIANRTHTEIERLIGFFANTLVFRADLADDPAFLELARRVRGSALGAYDHQDLPFEKLVDELHPERHLSYPPVFQVMFILQNAPAPEVSLAGLKLLPLEVDRGQSPFDLTLMLAESAGSWSGWLEYVSDLFDAATVARWATHLEVLLGGIVAGPERRVSELPLLMEAERRQLLFEWNATAVSWPGETLLHELFEGQAALRPAAWAVGFGAERLSYGELSSRSNRLARHLRRWGVGAEVRVGLCVERSAAMVVALLGILKAGGVYVPLDPSHPAERLGLVMADSAVPVLVAEERLLGRLPASLSASSAAAVRVVCLDRDHEAIAGESAEPLARFAEAENLAYVLYTSGSTGKPKGVGLPHRAVVNFLRSMAERPGLGASDVVPALTTLSFDIAGLEIYLPLSVGGRVEVLGREEAADGVRLAERLLQTGVTAMQATPATWRLLLESGWPGIAGLKGLCGGEALPRELAEGLLSRGVELWNVYGPTETAVWSSAGKVVAGEGPVLLGGPIANTELYVVDAGFAPVPVGVAGELWIGGAGLSRGYLHRPELTAEKLVPHPFGVAGARVYRTGDLVRYRPSGELEFLGRIDTQVKVRGFRIELGEIEAALGGHPSVRQAVVGVRGEGGDQRLVAYLVVLAAAAAPAADELRDFLRRSLPEYMVPAAFVVLESLPLTPSGKVDRKALPAPEAGPAETGYVAPRGPVEELVAAIWAEVLRVERVGARDNFFALGGHSLLATQVVSRLRTALGVELPLQRLFATPTVAGLARAVEEARREQEGWSLPPIVRAPRGASFPLSFSQERMWFLNQLDPGSAAYNLPQAVRLRGRLALSVLDRCFTELVRRHEALRTAFVLVEGKPAQVIQPPAPIRLEVVDLRHLPPLVREAESRRRAEEETARPFDLARAPLLRASLLRLVGDEAGEAEHVLLLTVHHICSDGWSLGVLVQELATLYRAFVAGEASPLPELPVQYVDFSTWQRDALSGDTLEAEAAYWRGKLAGSPPLLLPVDRRRATVHGFQVGVGSLLLPLELAERLKGLSRRHSASLYMTLLAVWKTLLARATGEEDLLLGAPIANRNRTEIEGLIGFFLNTLLLRTDATGDPAFQELLGRVRETCLGAFAHQDLPLEQVLQAVHASPDAGRSPFQVMFLLQNAPGQAIEVPGLTFSRLESEERIEDLGTAIFEAGLTLMEQPEGEESPAGIVASITYNALLFDAATIQALLGRYERLLAGVVIDPARPIWDYELLGPEERAELLAWGAEPPPSLPPRPVHRRFEERAAADPDAVAVIAGERRLTYSELNREANRLARHLRGLGAGPERVVGIVVERSPEMIVALLAVLKTGAAYVPLDPTYPAERLAYILRDAAAAVLVAHERTLAALPGLADERARVVRLDADAAEIATQAGGDLAVEVDPESLCYLIYTSGSTGKPKGVMVRHAALANYVEAFHEEHGLGAGDRVLQFASLSFDTSAEEIYPALASGAAVVLRNDAMLGSPPEFLRACAEWEISVLDLPTAFWHELVARLAADPAAAELSARLRLVILGGERALPERLAAWHSLGYRQVKLVNTYGPTECTIVATRSELAPELAGAGEVPIGRPVPGLRAYVLDPQQQLAAPGFPGELYVGGAGLARGYSGRSDLTAERFGPDPWGPEPGGRMYRTGDLVRLRPSGELEFLGRVDQQVKVRGFRVELREIEAALGEHPDLAAVVVVAREDTPGDRRLAAYVVARSAGSAPSAAELRSALKERLPDYMIPASFTVLDRLPLNPSGKVDRRALPAPDRARRRELERDYIAPRNDSEKTVATIWSELLGLDHVGVTENFFELGGHSLLLPQVVHRLRLAFRVEVPLRALFDEPTVEGLAITLEEILLEEIEQQLGEEEAVVE